MEWRIYPLDVLFFRGTEPMNAGEGGFTHSLFPPSPEVLQGMVRTAVLETIGVSFAAFAARPAEAAGKRADEPTAVRERALRAIGGPGGDLGRIDIRGPYLIRATTRPNGAEEVTRWYPAPLDLLQKEEGGNWTARSPNEQYKVQSDLGTVAFLPAADKHQHTGEGLWIREDGLKRYLQGIERASLPPDQVCPASEFWTEEPRVGIGRNSETRVAQDQMLYALSFVRLHSDRHTRVGIGLRVEGIPEGVERKCEGIRRLGGEGRMTYVETHPLQQPLFQPANVSRQARLLALTPIRWGGTWDPDGSATRGGAAQGAGWTEAMESPSATAAVPLTIVSAAVGKPVRIGGWDIVRKQPKPATACVPAGSVYYVRFNGAAVAGLHDKKVGDGARAGFGHIVAGRW